MFNPHMQHHQQHHHQQQQQQQQFHQHLRQLQQLFHQPPPPPPQPSAGHHVPHPPRAMPVPPQPAPPPRMVNLCQTTQTTIIAPNPMLQGALLMQQMQGNMRGFGMGGQQFRQFFAAGARSSLLGPVPMGVAIKSPMMGFPPARPMYPHVRYYNNNSSVPGSSSASSSTTDGIARQSDKRDIEQVTQDLSADQPGPSTAIEASEAGHTVNPNDANDCCIISESQLEEPVIKKQKTDAFEEVTKQSAVRVAAGDGEIILSDNDSQPEGSVVLESENESTVAEVQGSVPEDQDAGMPLVEEPQEEDCLLPEERQEEGEEDVDEGTNKLYCYLCSITCNNQQNFRSHMNSISHQQRMMEIQHMSNACLVTLLPRLQDSLQGTMKDGEKKNELKHWCATCQTHFSSSVTEHSQTKDHKIARKNAVSSCTLCKRHFRSSHTFIQHLRTAEHRKKVEMVQENDKCEEITKIQDGLVVEEEGSVSEEEENANLSNAEAEEDVDKQDGGTSKEVTLEDMDESVEYDPEVLYGGSFFIPVAGFICRLCSKFYHFESPDLHLHCKSLEHFENLKRYKTDHKNKGSGKCTAEEDSTCSSQHTSELSSKQPFISVCKLQTQTQMQSAESNDTNQNVPISNPSKSNSDVEQTGVEELTPSVTVGPQDSSETVPALTTDAAPSVETDADVEEKGTPRKKGSKTGPKRKTRTTNRR